MSLSVRKEFRLGGVFVQDSGKGMSESFIKNQLFKPLKAPKASLEWASGPTRVASMSVRLGGSMEVTSQVDHGTCLRSSFRRRRGAAGTLASALISQTRSQENKRLKQREFGLMNKKLLIVRDDPGLQSQMRWCFENTEVFVADDRESALSQLRRHEPQVVTLDLGLPPDPGVQQRGFSFCRKFWRLRPSPKSSWSPADEREKCRQGDWHGACDYYQKPLDAEILNYRRSAWIPGLYELEKKTGN